ncbi:MAG: hypothetical protein VW803_02995 [Aquiluna sp.]
MARFARVVVESKLLQLDRQFDFIVPSELESSIAFGSRVSFFIGRSKTRQTGFVVELLDSSEFATSSLVEMVGDRPPLTREIYDFAREVANRQCVAIGEILDAAVPDHMARTAIEAPETSPEAFPSEVFREVILSSGRQENVGKILCPTWMKVFAERAKETISQGHSALLLVPEVSDLELLRNTCDEIGLVPVEISPNQKRSERFKVFHSLLGATQVVIGTRSAIYAPVANLGLICLADDLDDSWREQGSPNTHTRELALMRAGDKASLLFAAPYRSLELQRLVEIGYLIEREQASAPPRISFTEPGLRLEAASFDMVKGSIQSGPLLVLLPRKGSSAAAYCQACEEKQRCICGGFIWEPEAGKFQCRICSTLHTSCQDCNSSNLKRGRTGSLRTVAEIGKAFPNATVYEATAEKVPTVSEKPNVIVVATPGSAPRLLGGYSGLLVLDCDVWLSMQHLTAEQLAMRDWTEALELLAPAGRAVFEGLGKHLGQPLALWQHVQLAKAGLAETTSLGLPPSVRIASLEGTAKVIEEAVSKATAGGAEVLRNAGGKALIKFKYSQGAEVSKALRAVAVKAVARHTSSGNRRGLKVVMDDMRALNS